MFDIDRTLKKVVSNLWFEWNSDVHALFRKVNPYVWSLVRRNLYRFFMVQTENPLLYRRHLSELLVDPHFLKLFKKVEADFQAYMSPAETQASRRWPELKEATIAYFSMEYGIDVLRTYSGGLGILSGDHVRGASDLGLKMVAVGLFYLHGYYDQQVDLDGTMRVFYEPVVPPHKKIQDFLPLEIVKKAGTQEEIILQIPIRDRVVRARVLRAKVGRTDLLLLDTNIPENPVHDRHITRRLYASQKWHDEERRRRLEQEIVLGLGGAQALAEAGYQPRVYHLNEGHVAFAAIEVIRRFMKQGFTFAKAQEAAAAIIGFTTHTPVPEGNERFDERIVREHLAPYLDSFLAPEERDTLFNCARNREDAFDMTKLAMLLSGVHRNGVSQLHGEVCRRMWGFAWGNHDHEGKGVPIGAITNSVHVPYWQKPDLRELIADKKSVHAIPDEALWALHIGHKTKLIDKVRERYAFQLLREKFDPQVIHDRSRDMLDVDSFIIGFARRFADYKRVTMLIDDEERLFRFIESCYRKYGKPVHILYAGKPHPNNASGRGRIRQIAGLSEKLAKRALERNFRGQVAFIQGYDIDLARYLVAGVDIWLNNPIRPLEASGTSGMKAGMNGVLNVSIPDGWVPEGVVTGQNGWLFGKGEPHTTDQDLDELYELLETQILPAFFERDKTGEGACPLFSRKWVGLMKNSIESITRQFNTDRMLAEYVEKMYLPAVRRQSSSPRQPVSSPS